MKDEPADDPYSKMSIGEWIAFYALCAFVIGFWGLSFYGAYCLFFK